MLRVEMRVEGHIDEDWSAWFEGLTIHHTPQGETLLCGVVADQAALHGLLAKLRDLGLPLLLLNSAPTEAKETGQDPTA